VITVPEVATAGDAFVVTWTGVDACRRRLIFQPRAVGGYLRIEQRRTDSGAWVDVGTEIVADVALDRGAEVVV